MSPAEYRSHVKAWNSRERRRSVLHGIIACTLINQNIKKGHPTVKLEDLIGEAEADE
jgi:hypothetical protein